MRPYCDREFQGLGEEMIKPVQRSSEPQADTLFTAYERGRGAHRDLGLDLCRQIIQAHHGTIGVITQPENGSRFWFTLPLV